MIGQNIFVGKHQLQQYWGFALGVHEDKYYETQKAYQSPASLLDKARATGPTAGLPDQPGSSTK